MLMAMETRADTKPISHRPERIRSNGSQITRLARWFCLGLAITALAAPAHAQTRAVKLWPQLTEGIFNHANTLTMKCEVAKDGLTVSDAAWDSYQVPGFNKRWTFNMGAPMDVPLKNFKFPREFSGLPINITVEFFNPAKPWEVKENYQEIVLLGGKQTIGLPKWFHVPTKRLAYDFDEGEWFPSGWTLPDGKYALWQGAAKMRQEDRKGQCPMYEFGFTHVSPIAMTPNGGQSTRERRANLFTDNVWVTGDGDAGREPKNWKIEPFYENADNSVIITPDFEVPGWTRWEDRQYEAFAGMIDKVRKRRPDVLIGCWAIGVVNTSFRTFDWFVDGKPTGMANINGAKQWREKYNDPSADLSPVFKRCNLNYGNPAVYWINNSKPSQLYAFMQEWEQGKLARPDVLNVLSTWIQVEFVDNYPLSQYRFTDANGKVRNEDVKHQVPASSTYALSLFGHCVMDGLQCWEIGTRHSEELADYSDWRVKEMPPKHVINGADVYAVYYLKYFGFYNFHVLGMWQASRNKDIIDAATKWEMPELYTAKNGAWRVGDERYPSYANFYKEPLVRAKLSANGKTLLVIACNPYNKGVDKVRIRLPGSEEEFRFDLVGDFPIIQRFPVTKPQ